MKFYNFLYKEANIFLKRKRDKFEQRENRNKQKLNETNEYNECVNKKIKKLKKWEEHKNVGLSAQNIKSSLKECGLDWDIVFEGETEDSPLTYNLNALFPILVKNIQVLHKQNAIFKTALKEIYPLNPAFS